MEHILHPIYNPYGVDEYSLEEHSEVEYDVLSMESMKGGGTVKQVLDNLLGHIVFDRDFLKKLIRVNINFITANQEIRDLMGSKLSGCFHLSYTQLNKNWFYNDLFDMDYNTVSEAIKTIVTIPAKYAVAKDDINLVTYYMAHRFLTSPKLTSKEKEEGAIESLNYFGYRTLVLLNAHYWKYPISRDKAVSITEYMSKNFLISNQKNWNEYVHYRSEQYIKNKFRKLLIGLNDDKITPNAINDLYSRYKDTIKNIYSIFLELEDNNYLKSSKSVVKDIEGNTVLLDRLNDPRSYVDKVLDTLSTKASFIRNQYLDVSESIITSISADQLRECLGLINDYYYLSPKTSKEVSGFIEDFITDSIYYLQDKKVFLNSTTSIIEVVNMIVGNVLYSRGTGISITEVKKRGEILIRDVYKKYNVQISSRNLTAMRNSFCVYILILSLL